MLRKSIHKFSDSEYSNGNVSGISLRTFSEDLDTATPTSSHKPNNPRERIIMAKSKGHKDSSPVQNYNSCSSSTSNGNNPVTLNFPGQECNNNDHSPSILVTGKPQKCAITVRGVNLSYQESILSSLKGTSRAPPVFVLNGLNLTVPVGAIYGLLGPSGCGKTSLLRCM